MKWEEPGKSPFATNGKKDAWKGPAEELKMNPGRWALLAENEGNPGLAIYIRQGKSSYWRPAGSFEARSRSNGDGTYRIYGRYVGEHGEHAGERE